MMHAAEASLVNDDGSQKLNRLGQPVKAGWKKKGDSWKWECSDPSVKAYRNSNGDIFPEEELVKAYKKWVGKPLCIDHKSNSVDHVRGFIVDTYYDRNLKRVIALCALDKFNYPDLARKVSTGYSNSVSMGTAVGKAVCYDCGTVARVEQDFCQHMRAKSCYGEINVDLSPIELSIVVNGADPAAKIKHIIAAANSLNSYVELKNEQLNKRAAAQFNASFSFKDSDHDSAAASHFDITESNLDEFKLAVEDAFKRLEEISEDAKNIEKDTNDLVFNQSSGRNASQETELPNTDFSISTPVARFANEEISELKNSIESKLTEMQKVLDKLANKSTNSKEENMSVSKDSLNKEAYHQGGGGVNEPALGEVKYEKDPMQEKLRLTEDKHMVGQKPFPEVGDVDGLHPSPSSQGGGSELDRKKMLARAEAEERAMRRSAAVQAAKSNLETKKAYHHGGGGVNEPALGKVKYEKDGLQEDLRLNDDKHMVGQKPFPDTGAVDGLHPSPASVGGGDELERKKMLRRASLKARFVKSAADNGTVDLGNSAWEVYLGDKLLLTASVNDITGGRADALYDTIATKEFGGKLIEKVKVFGADRVSSMYKSAQMPAAPTGTPADAAAPVPAMPEAPAAAVPAAEDKGGEGDPKEKVSELAQQAVDVTSDLLEATRALTGEQSEMGDLDAVKSASSNSLNKMRKELNGALISSMKEAVAELSDHKSELDMISSMYDNGTVGNSAEVAAVVNEAIVDAKNAIANSYKLMGAFVKYARGTEALVKRAEMESMMSDDSSSDSSSGSDSSSADDLFAALGAPSDERKAEDANEADAAVPPGQTPAAVPPGQTPAAGQPAAASKPGQPGQPGHVTASTKEGRAALRAKIASEMKFHPILHDAHPKGGETTELDVKPEGDLALVEDLVEVNDKMMDLAKASPKVRKEAEAIHQLVSEGKLAKSDVDSLASHGVDKETVAYYKKFFSQVDGGSEFATELVKEHAKAELEQEKALYRVKLARAYELAYDMVDSGLIARERSAISAQVDEVMKFNDESFESMKRVVAKHAPSLTKSASKIPQVGMLSNDPVSAEVGKEDLRSQLSAAFNSSTRKNF